MVVNLENIQKNALKIKELSKKEIIAVVKSNAYGFGSLEVAKSLKAIGVSYFAVLNIEEAKVLLSGGLNANLILLNSVDSMDYKEASKLPNIVFSINSISDALIITELASNKTRVHIQIDTGMNRLGLKTSDEYKEVLSIIKENILIEAEGIYTHFCSLDSVDKQLLSFKNIVGHFDYKMIHCGASSTFEKADFGNYVRVGLALYGAVDKMLNIVRVTTKPLAINTLSKGQSVGYLEAYTASGLERVAVLPLGYANGFFQGFQGMSICVLNKKCFVVGRICMNHIFVVVDDSVTLDTEFELLGDRNTILDLSKKLKISPYEVCTGLNIKKEYINK